MENDKLFLSRIDDLFKLCTKYGAARFSAFLDGAQAAELNNSFKAPYGYNTMLFGGYEDSERKKFGVFPEWEEASTDAFPITAVKISCKYSKKLTHRDYLGTIMSLGIDRSKTGDICVGDGEAYVFVDDDIAEYIKANISKIANVGVNVTLEKCSEVKTAQKRYEMKSLVCASMRLDAVCAAICGKSRENIKRMINLGEIKLNYKEETDLSKSVKEGDLLSLKGYGRFILQSIDGTTGKGRMHISVKKFI